MFGTAFDDVETYQGAVPDERNRREIYIYELAVAVGGAAGGCAQSATGARM